MQALQASNTGTIGGHVRSIACPSACARIPDSHASLQQTFNGCGCMQETAMDADLHANEKAIGVVLPCLDGERVGDAGGGGCHTNSTLEVLCFVSQSGIWKNLQEDAERRETRLDNMWDVKKLPPPHAVS